MSTRRICFRGEIRKLLCANPLLSGALNYSQDKWVNFAKPGSGKIYG